MPTAPPPTVPSRITQGVVLGDTPGSPGGGVPAIRGVRRTLAADPRREYVAGGTPEWWRNYVHTLPWAFDEVTRDFGDDVYERMSFDGQVAACLNILKASILEEGAEISSAIDDSTDPGYGQATALVDFCSDVLDNLVTSLDDVLWNMLDCIAVGNKVAEQIYEYDTTYTGKTQLVLRDLKVKPRHATAFVVDSYRNTIGLLARIPGVAAPVQAGTYLLDLDARTNVLPRAKFAVMTYRMHDQDIRGTSVLRPAYNAWWLKMQVWPEYLRYLTQFAGPSLVGITAPDAQNVPDDTPGAPEGAEISPEEVLLKMLQTFKNGTALALTNGAEVHPIYMQGDGQAFLHALDQFDKQITKAILTQTLATDEGKHQARAAAQVHQTVLYTIVRQSKKAIQRMIRQDILRPLCVYNFGTDVVKLVPFVTLGSAEEADFVSIAQAVSQLATAEYLAEMQLPVIDRMMGLPARDPGAVRISRTQISETIQGAGGAGGTAPGATQEDSPQQTIARQGAPVRVPNQRYTARPGTPRKSVPALPPTIDAGSRNPATRQITGNVRQDSPISQRIG